MQTSPANFYEFDEFQLDPTKRLLRRLDGRAVPLTSRVFDTLLYMVEHHDAVLDKERIMEAVWPDSIVEENNLAQAISKLRHVFGETPGLHKYIVTVPGRGYRFVADVREVIEEPASLIAQGDRPHAGIESELAPMASDQTTTAASYKPSIAVLPFANMSPERDQDYFCDGIGEEIINRLAQIKKLRVAPRMSAFRYKHSPTDSRTVGAQLAVTHLLEGSVRKADNRLRITVQLIDVAADSNVWSQKYDRRIEDLFAIQEDIAQSIVQALEIALTAGEDRILKEVPTTKVAAYDLYLRGRAFFYRGTRRDHDFARQMFSHAIEIDPTFTRAYAGLADTLSLIYKHFNADRALLDEADAASARARELSSELPEAYTSRGVVHWLMGRDEEAHREFETAIRLAPELFDAHYLFGIACLDSGMYEKAALLFRQASHVRSEDYQSLINLGSVLRALGRKDESQAAYDQGLSVARNHLELNPDDARAWYMGASALVALGKIEQGLEWAGKAESMEPDNPLLFENLAGIYAAVGRIDQGLDCIERAVKIGFRHRGSLEYDPDLAALRTHPRFVALLDHL